jgi:hypothetical protein
MLTTTQYPVLFTYRDVVIGAGYVAHVEASGRFLIEDRGTGEDVWIYGVNPGGLAAKGPGQEEAAEEFRASYRTVLIDLAEESVDFDAFKNQVENFYWSTCEATEKDWQGAVTRVRKGEIDSDWLAKKPAEHEYKIKVTCIASDRPQPQIDANPSMNSPSDSEAVKALAA